MAQYPTPKPGILDITPYAGGKSKAAGANRIIKLSSNENPWGPPEAAITAYRETASTLHRYPDGGHLLLKQALHEIHQLPESELICGAGSDELIGLLVHAYAGVGDEVLFSEHGFLMYRIYTLANGATPVTAPEKNLTADVEALLAAVTPKTKIVFLANPNNPTGTSIPFTEVRRLREKLPENVILGLDAAYSEYMESDHYEAGHRLVTEGTNTVVFHTFSKIYGLPALRLGWAHGPAVIIDVMNRIRSPFNLTSPALAAGVAALKDRDFIDRMRQLNAQEMTRVAQSLTQLGLEIVPSQVNFLLVKFPATPGQTAADANQFLMARGIIPREVVNYGLPEYLRISLGTTEENHLLLAALTDFITQRKSA